MEAVVSRGPCVGKQVEEQVDLPHQHHNLERMLKRPIADGDIGVAIEQRGDVDFEVFLDERREQRNRQRNIIALRWVVQ